MKRSSSKHRPKWQTLARSGKAFAEGDWSYAKVVDGKTVALHPNGLPVLGNSSKGTHFTSSELREAVGAVFAKGEGKKRQLSAAKH